MLIRPARKSDASEMVALIDCAGYGMPLWVWEGMRTDEASVLEVGRRRAMRDEGGFSYRNAHMLELDGTVAAMLIGYRLDDPYQPVDRRSIPEAFWPLVELEAEVPGSWYINVLAVHAEYRRCGLGTQLLAHAGKLACECGAGTLSVIFESRNAEAFRLYQHCGFAEQTRRPRVPFPGDRFGSEEWVLLIKNL